MLIGSVVLHGFSMLGMALGSFVPRPAAEPAIHHHVKH
jgi:hypothetical protein